MQQHQYSLGDEVSPNIRPGDDFFGYVNQKWLDSNPIPPNKSQVTAFSMLDDENVERLKALLDGPESDVDSPTTSLVKTFYRTAMDQAAIESVGVSPIQPLLNKILDITTKEDVLSYITDQHATDKALGWSTGITVDDKDSGRYVVRLYQSGLGLPDRDYYFENGERFDVTRKEYQKFLGKLFDMLGQDMQEPAPKAQAKTMASEVYAIELALARVSQTAVERRDDEANYNLYTVAQLNKKYIAINWTDYFVRIGLGNIAQVIVSQPAFIDGFLKLLEDRPVKAWQHYLIARTIIPYLSSLSKKYDELQFSFYGKVLSGATEQEPRYRRVIRAAIGSLPEPTGQLYAAHHFDSNAKQQIIELVDTIKAALRKRIKQLDWMSDSTKQKAYTKLDSFIPLLGYPDIWRDYSPLHLGNSHYANLNAIRCFEWQTDTNRIINNKPVDRSEWLTSPAVVNAYYWPNANSITFPAGILQPPYFDAGGDFAANYGGIGMVIGHEISHGFDDAGSKYDPTGNLKPWWSAKDRKAFEARTKKLQLQYDSYTVADRPLNGALTLGENIGDLGGMLIAFDAMQAHIEKFGDRALLDGFTPEQRFFMSQARIWHNNMRPESQLRQLVSDTHSPAKYRVNGVVTNVDAFYKAFNVAPNDALYTPPADRVRIW
jgi:putative endopeptidase